jgi:hypothetical protein
MVSVGAEGRHRHPSRDARALASGRLSLLLALEIALAGRAPADQRGTARFDSAHEHREPLWGAPRIHGELLKLGFEVAQSSVAKYMVKRHGPPSQGWRTFLRMPAITTKSEHIDHWTRMHQSRGQFSGSETSRHMHFSGACIANMFGVEFSVHTPISDITRLR